MLGTRHNFQYCLNSKTGYQFDERWVSYHDAEERPAKRQRDQRLSSCTPYFCYGRFSCLFFYLSSARCVPSTPYQLLLALAPPSLVSTLRILSIPSATQILRLVPSDGSLYVTQFESQRLYGGEAWSEQHRRLRSGASGASKSEVQPQTPHRGLIIRFYQACVEGRCPEQETQLFHLRKCLQIKHSLRLSVAHKHHWLHMITDRPDEPSDVKQRKDKINKILTQTWLESWTKLDLDE